MYQAEVKRYVVEYLFPPAAGWKVVVDLDGMEKGKGGNQSAEKQARAAACMTWFREHGVKVMKDREFGRRDIVARHHQHGTVLVEAESISSRQPEQALYSALGQAVLQMMEFKPTVWSSRAFASEVTFIPMAIVAPHKPQMTSVEHQRQAGSRPAHG